MGRVSAGPRRKLSRAARSPLYISSLGLFPQIRRRDATADNRFRHARSALAMLLLAVLVAIIPAPVQAQGNAQSATYRVTFTGMFAGDALASGVSTPSGAHFTTLIGAVHNDSVTYWRSGGTASAGIESMAELGGTAALKSEINVNGDTNVLAVIEKSIASGGTATATVDIEVTAAHPLVTLVTMVAPSPDWFVGVSGLSLRNTDGDGWWQTVTVDLFPYDAGTEEGTEFSLSNAATSPRGTIASIKGTGKFSNEPLARLTFTKLDEAGAVSLFPAEPRVGTVLRAALSDPDGIDGLVNWQWAKSTDRNRWSSISNSSGSDYAPTEVDRGEYLRATAAYSDGQGSSRTAEEVSDNPVGERAPAPEISVTTLISGLNIPWDIAFTHDGTMLFTERAGVLSSRFTDGTVQRIDADLRDLFAIGETGLMGIAVDPDFGTNRRFYTCQGHTGPEVQVLAWTIDSGYTTATRVADPLVGGIPATSGRHGGCRLRFGADGYLWIATGDAASGTVPQDLNSLGGKILRVNASTGAGAPANPFASSPLIYTYGHRNVQGLALRPGTRQMWSVEHGPTVDDEINLLAAGGNYGWNPVPGYNERVPMTDLVEFPSAIEARWSSGPSTLAASGAIFLEGEHWDEWEGRLAVATLRDSKLRLFEFTSGSVFSGQVVVAELDDAYGRLRTPMLGLDGALYVTTSNGGGADQILRISPASAEPEPLPPVTAALVLSETVVTAPEGGSAEYTVALAAEPAGVVTVTATGAEGTVTVTPSMLTFTADNWDQAQTVMVSTARDDAALADQAVILTHTAAGAGYDEAPLAQVLVLVTVAGDDNRNQVQTMYVAYYGRPGDAGGLDFWAGELEKANGRLKEIIDSFGNSKEFQDRFGDLDDEELVNNIYQQLLGRDADSGGLGFYVNGLREGRFTLASIALNVADGAGQKPDGRDAATVANKLHAANAFSAALASTGAPYGEFQIDDAKLWLGEVDSTAASVTAALNRLPDLLEMFAGTAPFSFRTTP
ncbi:MAG: PQQ-dependent sugar dehydrogenase [Halieaceae bacterium]|nr:PQQ-dependent sugar dehydrogenase [Halieaceae bacterium]